MSTHHKLRTNTYSPPIQFDKYSSQTSVSWKLTSNFKKMKPTIISNCLKIAHNLKVRENENSDHLKMSYKFLLFANSPQAPSVRKLTTKLFPESEIQSSKSCQFPWTLSMLKLATQKLQFPGKLFQNSESLTLCNSNALKVHTLRQDVTCGVNNFSGIFVHKL